MFKRNATCLIFTTLLLFSRICYGQESNYSIYKNDNTEQLEEFRNSNTTSEVESSSSTVITASEDGSFPEGIQEPPLDPSITIQEGLSYPFREKLYVKPLPNNDLLTSFQFKMNSEEFAPSISSLNYGQYNHFTVFPKAIESVLHRTDTRQLHLRFTRGFWDAETWGRLPHDGFKSGGNGVELWAIIEAESKDNAYSKWKTLANSLSGLFCASINFIDSSKTTYPVTSFQPDNDQGLPVFANSKNQLYLIRAALANEPICTENLTPFLKLLPTKGKSGISTFLDGHKVFDSSWHSLSVDVITNCDVNQDKCKYETDAVVDMVTHVPYSLARNKNPIPKPLPAEQLRCDTNKPYDAFQCFPLPESTETEFDLSQIFGKTIKGSSMMSDIPSHICAIITSKWDVSIKVNGELFGTDDNCFELDGMDEYDLYLASSDTSDVTTLNEEVPLHVSRSLTGYGQDHGGLRTVFQNPTPMPITAIYFESLPWYMRLYLSSLKLESIDSSNLQLEDVIDSVYYNSAIDHKRPSHLEYTITIPANTTLAISCQFDKALLHFADYPPDANHGFEIESAVITVIKPFKYQIRTETLLLSLSTPDFSMPYNVIIITSTVIGLIYGTLYNLLVKKVVRVEQADKLIEQQAGLKKKLVAVVLKLKSKVVDRIKQKKVINFYI
ncbi:GPI-anchor transamidase subunit GPI16 NDAI_0C03560 [Naumovozyma dairenensis CBS 421]|uniref:GPI transamidase component GPI16 n=1 Tax=Naumovozyma dairenensis (strain ATCC 10597 / BCRC 20456 / CBS 421 / NBRC 0211 / NRRL Y-12639) TaxID=1071378 RepID=G0W8A5_NAUDC|nr:hypothetical protein NDAI_0C03560 [Naumovozyma dairenensis CBS 421]CCD24016.1 hypothetical protein NDAI_0C03560 [Naumovozyma dairenensis CBS 421]